MIYLDYAATTPVEKTVLDTFNKVSLDYIGNSNSIHKLGILSKDLLENAIKQISNILGCMDNELIFTGSATESNNLALKGIALRYRKMGNHIITTKIEHSSIKEIIKYLESIGYIIEYVNIDEYGKVNLDHLKKLINKNTILVSIISIDSELGVIQEINEIGKLIKKLNPNTFFHTDATQKLGKLKISLECVDLMTFSSHKIYGLKGIAGLYKKNNIELIPIIHGGKSNSVFRSSTPLLPLVVSFSKAIRVITENIDKNYEYVNTLKQKIIDNIKDLNNVIINSNNYTSPYILNVSVLNIKPETFIHALDEYNIFISTKSACSTENISDIIYEVTKNVEIAIHTLRISFSHKTSEYEIEKFIEKFRECYNKLSMRGE